jgi:hypothetical protein
MPRTNRSTSSGLSSRSRSLNMPPGISVSVSWPGVCEFVSPAASLKDMMKCFKCGGGDIAKGEIFVRSDSSANMVFEPEGIRFFSFTYAHGTKLRQERYACLTCGIVWSQTNPSALREFIRKYRKRPSNEESTG